MCQYEPACSGQNRVCVCTCIFEAVVLRLDNSLCYVNRAERVSGVCVCVWARSVSVCKWFGDVVLKSELSYKQGLIHHVRAFACG